MTNLILDPDIPVDVIEAAAKVSAYMETKHGTYWQLMGLCDRRFTLRPKTRATRSCGDCEPCLGGRLDQCYLYPKIYDR